MMALLFAGFSPFRAVSLALALVVAVFIAMPYLLFQFWGFVAPGLYTHEKRLALPLVASSIVLFYLGMAFAYVVVFPLVFGFFTAVTPDGVAQMRGLQCGVKYAEGFKVAWAWPRIRPENMLP